MQYLVTYVENGVHKAWYSKWFDVDNNFNEEIGMIVYDLWNDKYMSKAGYWNTIVYDHL